MREFVSGLNEGNAAEGCKESHVKLDEILVPLNYLSFFLLSISTFTK